jgi:hypothetical protein
MGDIVEKLRKWRMYATHKQHTVLGTAADEIESLRHQLAECQIQLITNCNSCEYKALKPPTDSGWCYMFKTKPDGICMQHSLNKFIYSYNKKVD